MLRWGAAGSGTKRLIGLRVTEADDCGLAARSEALEQFEALRAVDVRTLAAHSRPAPDDMVAAVMPHMLDLGEGSV